jgi:hypothetical protein
MANVLGPALSYDSQEHFKSQTKEDVVLDGFETMFHYRFLLRETASISSHMQGSRSIG